MKEAPFLAKDTNLFNLNLILNLEALLLPRLRVPTVCKWLVSILKIEIKGFPVNPTDLYPSVWDWELINEMVF